MSTPPSGASYDRPREEARTSWQELPEPDYQLTESILNWFEDHGRTYLWRHIGDPYLTLCTEVFLQRTRADQVVPVFEEFWDLCRNPEDVIEQGRDWVESLFDRLGLRWRAEHFWSLQETLTDEHGGEVPSGIDELMALPGVGRYAATATRVFAFGESKTVLDSNTLRIFGRYFGIEFPDHARRSPRVARWASEFAPENGDRSRKFNWGLIDFGAEVCTPSNPRCDECPVSQGCWYATHRTGGNDLS